MECLRTKMLIIHKLLRERFPHMHIQYNNPFSISVGPDGSNQLLFSDIERSCFLTLSNQKENVLSSHIVTRIWYARDINDVLWTIQRFSIINSLRIHKHTRVPSLKTLALYNMTTSEVAFARTLTVVF